MERHSRFWLGILFGIGTPILATLLRGPLVKLYTTESLAFARIPVSYALSVLYGALLGIAAACTVAPRVPGKPLRPGVTVGISAALIVVSYVLGSLLAARSAFYLGADIFLAVTILAVAHACVPQETAAAPEPGGNVPLPARRGLGLALTVGFLPSALILAAIAVASSTNLGKQESDALLWACCIVSVFCCLVASITLFSRKTGGAVAGGILLLLLNAFIAFFFGCCASINFGNMH